VKDLKPGFTRFHAADPDRLHFAAHSHHPWPDVTHAAHERAWLDAAELADDKWERYFGEVVPATQRLIGDVIGLDDPKSITFGPNTHGFVNRIFSCFEPPVRVLTTDAEFHSFHRQSRRWEEAGVAIVDRIPAEPFDTFEARFTREAAAGAHDLIYLSQVHFDSGLIVEGIDRVVSAVPNNQTFIVVDGYHAFMAMPVNVGAIQDRVFYLAGGYKYAMAGEGACFLHAPAGYGPRPLDTGWYAGFGQLESGVTDLVPYAEDGSRFAGATYDVSGVYRLRAVLEWLRAEGVTPGDIHDHAGALQDRLLHLGTPYGDPVVPAGRRGNFLTFQTADAAEIYRALHERKVITDYRGDRLRIGFGVYQDDTDVDRLADTIAAIPVAE
jgi:selenocysteine lyase/cysteine desulfurase